MLIAPVLSEERGVGVEAITPKSSSSHRSQVISAVTAAIALNSASTLKRESVVGFLVFQAIKEDPRNTISKERATIRVVTGPCCIRVCLKLKRVRTREQQLARGSAMKISLNSKEVSLVKLGGCKDKTYSECEQHGKCQDE